ncbi:MAG: hypothetical protein M3280_13820 [Actinomycetota bacterium]|nr:hypothetical protein [Actinomycetota bacterium]
MNISKLEQLSHEGLIESSPEPHLTDKGRDWLRMLSDIETHEVADSGEMAADLVLSTSGLIR